MLALGHKRSFAEPVLVMDGPISEHVIDDPHIRIAPANAMPGELNRASVIRVGVTGKFVRPARFVHAVAGSV